MDVQQIKDRIKEEEQKATPLPEEKPQMSRQLKNQIEEFQIASENLNQVQTRKEVNLIPMSPQAEKMQEEATKTLPDIPVQGFNDPRLQEAIEKKCSEMDFADLIMTGSVIQGVPILAKKLTIEFQSLTGTESFWVNTYVQTLEEAQRLGWSYYLRLTMSIRSVNNKLWEPHLLDNKVQEKVVIQKLEQLLKMSEQVLSLISVHQRWFNLRVDKLFAEDLNALKNG